MKRALNMRSCYYNFGPELETASLRISNDGVVSAAARRRQRFQVNDPDRAELYSLANYFFASRRRDSMIGLRKPRSAPTSHWPEAALFSPALIYGKLDRTARRYSGASRDFPAAEQRRGAMASRLARPQAAARRIRNCCHTARFPGSQFTPDSLIGLGASRRIRQHRSRSQAITEIAAALPQNYFREWAGGLQALFGHPREC